MYSGCEEGMELLFFENWGSEMSRELKRGDEPNVARRVEL